MERDCVAAHGITEFTKERFMECSDGFGCYICNSCGRLAIANPKDNIWECKICSNTTDFRSVQIPYAYKLMMQEMESMGIVSRIKTENMMLRSAKHLLDAINEHDEDEGHEGEGHEDEEGDCEDTEEA